MRLTPPCSQLVHSGPKCTPRKVRAHLIQFVAETAKIRSANRVFELLTRGKSDRNRPAIPNRVSSGRGERSPGAKTEIPAPGSRGGTRGGTFAAAIESG